jgi:exopolysaccharide production protein ExoY
MRRVGVELSMANGISVLAARRREKPAPETSWRTTATFDAGSTNQIPSAGRSPDYAAAPANVAWLRPKAGVLGGSVKRVFDISFALTAIVVLLPLIVLIALAIKLWDGGPILYRHRRIGLNGEPFDCLKFRSMVMNGDEVLSRHLASNREAAKEWRETRKLKDDPRVTPLGAGMRKTSIDELPQLLNILKGEMSLVGPRPIVTDEMLKYGDAIGHYLRVRPGLTGPWQISGRNDASYTTRVQLDRDYVEDWSFRRDLVIIAKTVRAVLSAHGSY